MSHNDPSPETRHSLILRLRNPDDVMAWQEFVEIYQPLICTLAIRKGLQKADADDVSQEVLTQVAKHIETWKPSREGPCFRAWLSTVTRNETLLFFRKHGRHPSTGWDSTLGALPLDIQESDFDLEHERHLFAWASRRVQARFDSKNWRAFWLTAVEGHSVEKVAQQLKIKNGQVYVARSRIMAALKCEIERTSFDSRVDWSIS